MHGLDGIADLEDDLSADTHADERLGELGHVVQSAISDLLPQPNRVEHSYRAASDQDQSVVGERREELVHGHPCDTDVVGQVLLREWYGAAEELLEPQQLPEQAPTSVDVAPVHQPFDETPARTRQ